MDDRVLRAEAKPSGGACLRLGTLSASAGLFAVPLDHPRLGVEISRHGRFTDDWCCLERAHRPVDMSGAAQLLRDARIEAAEVEAAVRSGEPVGIVGDNLGKGRPERRTSSQPHHHYRRLSPVGARAGESPGCGRRRRGGCRTHRGSSRDELVRAAGAGRSSKRPPSSGMSSTTVRSMAPWFSCSKQRQGHADADRRGDRQEQRGGKRGDDRDLRDASGAEDGRDLSWPHRADAREDEDRGERRHRDLRDQPGEDREDHQHPDAGPDRGPPGPGARRSR